MVLDESGFLDVGGRRLEYRFFGPQPAKAPTLVLLHEGLGCVGLWNDFPEKLSAATGVPALTRKPVREGQAHRGISSIMLSSNQ